MVLSREQLVATLFRETDRAQRMKSPLGLVYFGIEDAAELKSQLRPLVFDAAVDGLMRQVLKLLRCYDSLGQMAEGEFVLLLPGCNAQNASVMAGRINAEVRAVTVNGSAARVVLSGCYGVTASWGRSPLVVLREAQSAFKTAGERGPGSVEVYEAERGSGTPLIPVIEHEALRW